MSPNEHLCTQVRAAKTLDPAVVQELRKCPAIRNVYIFDNPYLSGMRAANSKQKLTSAYAVMAVSYISEDVEGKDFQPNICKPLKAVEQWEQDMVRKYGVVASASVAFQRVLCMLQSRGGLQRVVTCLSAGQALHVQAGGLDECVLLVKEMEKCKAGGHPPPAVLPTGPMATEVVEADADSAGEALVMTNLGQSPAAEASEASEENPEKAAVMAKVKADLAHITPVADADILVEACASHAGRGRVVCMVEAPTSRLRVAFELLEVAKRLSEKVASKEEFRLNRPDAHPVRPDGQPEPEDWAVVAEVDVLERPGPPLVEAHWGIVQGACSCSNAPPPG